MAMGLAWALGARRTHSSCTNPLYIELPERLIELCVLIKLCNKNSGSFLDSNALLEDIKMQHDIAFLRND